MKSFLLILYCLFQCANSHPDRVCDRYKGDFDIKKHIGIWHVVAIIPDRNYTRNISYLPCYRVDFSEVDEAGLKWMISQKFGKIADELIDRKPGDVLRLRYHTANPFDIWSKSIPEESGCYKQLVDLRNNETDISGAKQHNSPMLLHYFEQENDVFLLQILWGRISTVIYKRESSITMNQLQPVMKFLSLYRGSTLEPITCSSKSTTQRTNLTTFSNIDSQ